MKLFEILSTIKNDFMLKEVTEDISEFSHEGLEKHLKDGYLSKDANIKRTTVMFNSAFTHRALTFLMTNKSFAKVINNDPGIDYKNCDSTSYKMMVRTAIKHGFIKQLRPGKTGKAGLYEIVHPSLIEIMKEIYLRDVDDTYEEAKDFNKIYEKRKEDAIEYWEGENNIEKEPLENERVSVQVMRSRLREKGIDV